MSHDAATPEIAMHRSVTHGTFTIERTYPVTPHEVFEAWAREEAKDAWFASPSPMGTLADTYVGSWLSVLIDLVIIIDALSLAVAIMVTASRIIFALGRDGLLPRAAARTSAYGGRNR